MEKKLYKSSDDKIIDGVCAGIAEFFGVDSTLIRVLWAVLSIFAGAGVLAYIVCALIMPRKPSSYIDV